MHPFGDLSAYLDAALSAEARASVQAHLDTCALCRTRLAELRGTARLIAALPMPVPSRSLVPRVSIPFWLAPLRTFSTFATGAAIFLFIASAVIAYFPRMQSAGTAAAPAAAQPAASGAGDTSLQPPSSLNFNAPSPSAAPAVTTDRSGAVQSATPGDATKEVGRQDSASPSSNVALDQSTRARAAPVAEPSPFALLLSPWLWLVLAIAFAAMSFAVGRRLRST
ncbi:MAG TPA: zf-HC2 domain-containing protein [Methylomirabilota bacterium]|nr:zf-HC2 domain-containing protein [Methylomirabilota bacterium]